MTLLGYLDPGGSDGEASVWLVAVVVVFGLFVLALIVSAIMGRPLPGLGRWQARQRARWQEREAAARERDELRPPAPQGLTFWKLVGAIVVGGWILFALIRGFGST